MKFRAHDTFFIRKGWLSKGMKYVNMQMLRHTKIPGILQVNEWVWKRLTAEKKAEIEKICDESWRPIT